MTVKFAHFRINLYNTKTQDFFNLGHQLRFIKRESILTKRRCYTLDTYKVQTLQSKTINCTLLTAVHVVAKSENNLKGEKVQFIMKMHTL